jgi:hypothetical protein
MLTYALEWLSNDVFWFATVVGFLVLIALKFEKRLPSKVKQILIVLDLCFTVTVFACGLLKAHLDAKWQSESTESLLPESSARSAFQP